MENFPRHLRKFIAKFATDSACRDYLFRLRWPHGFRCPRCAGKRYSPVREMFLECAKCGHQTSVTAGTIFQDTRKPLADWFRAMYWFTTQKNWASALELQRVLGLGSYKTAWTWLHKLRRAMARTQGDRLAGHVEVDEICIGGTDDGARGRRTARLASIVIAAQVDGFGIEIGGIQMRRIPDVSAGNVMAFVNEAIWPGSTVHTGTWFGSGYFLRLEAAGYHHKITFLKSYRKTASDIMPRVQRVASLLNEWLSGAHQPAITKKHLDYYLDEFTFRFNHRRSCSRGKLFYRLVQRAVAIDPVPYKSMVHGNRRVNRH